MQPWPEIVSFFDGLTKSSAIFEPMRSVARSIVEEGASELLCAHTSMHDLVVTRTPVPETPCETVRVGLHVWPSGCVFGEMIAIEHQSLSGRDDQVVRTGEEAVPLFWRFMIEKFAVHPQRDF